MLCHSIASGRLSLAGHKLGVHIVEPKQSYKYEIGKLNRSIEGKSINSQKTPTWARLEMNEQYLLSDQSSEEPSTSTRNLLPEELDNIADDTTLANPLQRMKRLSTGWIGVIIDYEGGVTQDFEQYENQAWASLIQESGRFQVLQWQLARACYMKNEQVIQEVLCISKNPSVVRQLSERKEEYLASIRGSAKPAMSFGLKRFIQTLKQNDVPVAIVTSGPEKRIKSELQFLGLLDTVDTVVYSEDVARCRPDSEPYWFASTQLKRPMERCVVVASSNLSIEGATEAGMKSVAIANSGPMYEVSSADLVVKSLDMLSFVNMKQLFGQEGGRMPLSFENEHALEEDDDDSQSSVQTAQAVLD